MMDLYYSPASPFARKVLVLLHETAQAGAVTLVSSQQTPLEADPSNVAQNPLGKVPTLTRPDGPALYDSRVICRYLDDRAGAGLYPASRIWEVLTLEATADGILDAAVLMVYEGRIRPEDKRFPGYVDAQWTKIARALDAIEARWMSHLTGPLGIGQIAVGCALGYLDFRHPDRPWRDGHDTLVRWFERFDARPSMQATRPS